MPTIGICGPEGTGKDTTAERIQPEFSRPGLAPFGDTYITSYAEPLYEMISCLTGVPTAQLRKQGYKDTLWTRGTAPVPSLVGLCPRGLLRDVGMWVRDHVDKAHWAMLLRQRTAAKKGWWLVTDLRFESEVPYVDYVVEVRRAGIDYKNDHPSSTRLPEYLIHHVEWLTPDMDYADFTKRLINKIVPKNMPRTT